ncbi:hypothetical protein INR49_016689, partial [Caranx melampygus]
MGMVNSGVKRRTGQLSQRTERKNRRMIVVCLLCLLAGGPAAGQTLDVCTTCHTNATCDDKDDGSGKVCNCMYGFVGNGRTYCQDKDECQIGASRICGQHTTCHNTYGSYYCRCLSGYIPSNHMDNFIPNDGTHCQVDDAGVFNSYTLIGSTDIDECRTTGLCGEGGLCRNLDGSYECSCQVGYRVHNGVEPFHPDRDKASCKVVDCGQPATVEDTVLLSLTGTTYGSTATFVCDEGFIRAGGDNTSVCGANGVWGGTSLVCEAKCGPVPLLANSEVVWHNRSVVIHRCVEGYHSWRGSNASVCGTSGVWQEANLRCIEIKPPINHLSVVNEICLQWRAEKYEEDTEFYKVTYEGSRDYQRSFRDKRKRLLSSKAEQLELCLNLLPVTNYSISITAVSARFTATTTTSTSLPVPPAPVVYYREYETPVPMLRLRRTANTLDIISLYQVFVLQVEEIMVCTAAAAPQSTMAQNQVILQFRFATFGDSMLQKMNLLRQQRRFCDVAVRINQVEVPGHKVVFAAGSSFLRDQFILQQDSREVQISMIQKAEVGRQLLLSCYTGQLEFPELELVHYLTVASFLQMGHIVEQCTLALSKFIKPQAARSLKVDVDMKREKREDGSSSEAQREQEHTQMRTVHQVENDNKGDDEEEEEEEEDDDNDDDDVIIQPKSPLQVMNRCPKQSMAENDITIVKVESVSDVAENSITGHFPTSPPAALHSPEAQHSLINSTVDSRSSEMAVPPGMAEYPLTVPAEKHNAHQRNYDKPLQWYHHGDKPHRCNYCDMVFAHKPVLRKHLKQIHGKNSFDNANEVCV